MMAQNSPRHSRLRALGLRTLVLRARVHLSVIGLVMVLAGLMLGSSRAYSSSNAEQAVNRVNAYLNSFQYMRGDFSQIDPNGRLSTGQFFLHKPGRVRFEYDPPRKLLVVADGTWVGVIDGRLNITNRYPISATPLAFLVRENIDLRDEANILSIRELGDQIVVLLEEKSGKISGTMTLILEGREDLVLSKWIIEDARGERTSIALSNIRTTVEPEASLFVIKDLDPLDRKR